MGFGETGVRRYEPHGELPEHDLYLYIDDGRDDLEGWECPHPCAFYAIDTHLGYDFRLRKAKEFDYVFTAQRGGAEKMREDGIDNATWLPLACSPQPQHNLAEMLVHPEIEKLGGKEGLDKRYDFAFVGYMQDPPKEPGYHNRTDYLDTLFTAFPNSWLSFNVFFEDMAVRFIRARLGFNISVRNDLNMRFFEVLSTGTCLLTNTDVEGIEELGFEEGIDFIGYDGEEDMIERAKWGLENPMEREAIAQRGHEKVRAHHTYSHRMTKLFETCGFDWQKAVESNGK